MKMDTFYSVLVVDYIKKNIKTLVLYIIIVLLLYYIVKIKTNIYILSKILLTESPPSPTTEIFYIIVLYG